jgi:hypothetical protein
MNNKTLGGQLAGLEGYLWGRFLEMQYSDTVRKYLPDEEDGEADYAYEIFLVWEYEGADNDH